MQYEKLIVVGLDSFDRHLAEQWIAEGRLPNLAALMARGVVGPVRNVEGLESGSAWSCFAFGSHPGIHGFHDYMRGFDASSYQTVVHDLSQWRESRLWDRLGEAGKRSIVIDAQVPAPAGRPQGIVVSDWATHAPADGTATLKLKTWPRDLAQTILDRYGADPLGRKMCDTHRPRTAADLAWFRDALIRRIDMKTALVTDMMAEERWDFLLACFSDAHCAGHHCWHLHDRRHEEYDPEVARAVGNPLRDVYEALDRALGAIVDRAGDAAVMAYLSHGIEEGYTGVRLLDRILASLNGELDSRRDATLTGLRRVWRASPAPLRRLLGPLRQKVHRGTYNQGFLPDPSRRLCFEMFCNERTSGIRINLVGREAHGRVRPGKDYDELCDRLTDQLRAVVNEETGEPVIRDVIRTRDRYAGPASDRLPDLLVTWNRTAPIRGVTSPHIGRLRHPHPPIRTGDHRPDGMVVLAAPGMKARRLNHEIDVTELAPSIASLMGVDPSAFPEAPQPALTGTKG
jgi:predicted AlkP superfamily phosphohydrolase/phosphomutase